MKIIIPSIGTRGDVQIYIALAQGLIEAGHNPIVASHPMMCGLVEEHGIPFAPIGPDLDIGQEATAIRGRSRNWMLGFMRTMRFSFEVLEASHPDLLALCRGADLVIVSHTAAGKVEADLLGLPQVSVSLFPQAIPAQDPAAGVVAKAVGKVAGAAMGLLTSRPINAMRRRLGAGPLGPEGITSPTLNLLPISPAVYPPDSRWEPRHQMCGYWFAQEPRAWTPDPALLDFIAGGDRPIAVTLGAMSMGGADAREMAALFIEATKRAGLRSIIQGWDEAFRNREAPGHIFHADSVPHSWLFPQAAGVVHHGGFGTASACFRAGTPALVIPHILDQFMWSQQVEKLGCGPAPLARSKVTLKSLEAALRALCGQESFKVKAGEIAASISTENGVQRAVTLIAQAREG